MIQNEFELSGSEYRAILRENTIKIPSDALLKDTIKFLDDFYKGCFEATIDARFTGCIKISPIKFAKMMKIIIKSASGTCAVPITISTAKNSLTVSVSKRGLAFSTSELSNLLHTAKNSGFAINGEDESITFKANFTADKTTDIFAVSKRIVYIMLQKEFQS